MNKQQGSLSINSENIFPIIKKWLYSDHDIFYRELISNGCDAITKLKKLSLIGEADTSDDVFKIALDTWQEAEDYVRVNNNAVKHKFSGLPIGYKDRIVDGYNRDKKIIYEVKYGRASLSEQIRSEIERDVYLRNNTDIESIEWHFFKSSKTGKGGQLVRYLKN